MFEKTRPEDYLLRLAASDLGRAYKRSHSPNSRSGPARWSSTWVADPARTSRPTPMRPVTTAR